MSSIQNDAAEPSNKKRRLRAPGACDTCKKKKIRCDSGGTPGNRCTNCTNAGVDCTHYELTKNLGSAKGYVEGLEHRLEKMETLLKKLLPGVDVNEEVEADPDAPSAEFSESLLRNDEDFNRITSEIENLKLDPTMKRFYGKSSGLYLVETALHHKHHHTGGNAGFLTPVAGTRRAEYWDPPEFQIPALRLPEPTYIFPDEDLIRSLTEYYFTRVNPFFPLLHRPTFERSIKERLHLIDITFGGSVLLVCAVGARYSDDPRVFSEGPGVPASAGWAYYTQVPIVRQNLQLSAKPTLYEIQNYSLSVLYIKASSVGQSTWTQIGFGLRMAQDVGAHRRRVLERPTIQDELWKRAFFVLLAHERTVGSFTGRNCLIHDDEYDVDFPVEIDDEYWDQGDPSNPTPHSWEQPADKPSLVSAFVHYVKLTDIMAYAMRTIYSLRKPDKISGRQPQQTDQQLITDLESAMNEWLESIPSHLKWDPQRKPTVFFEQSAMLYSAYYQLQIFIHRPFIPMPRRPSSVTFPSLTICATAARACSHVARVMNERAIILPFPNMLISVFLSAVILLLNTWSGKRCGITTATEIELADVHACMAVLKAAELRWPSCGRFWDMIQDIANAGDFVPAPQQRHSQGSPSSESDLLVSGSRPVAGTRRVMSTSHEPVSKTSKTPYDPSRNYGFHDYCDGSGSRFLPTPTSSNSNSPQDSLSSPSSNSLNSFPQSVPLPQSVPALVHHSIPSTYTGNRASDFSVSPEAFVPDPMANDIAGLHHAASMLYGPASDFPVDQADLDSFLASLPIMDNASLSMWSTVPLSLEMDQWGSHLTNFDPTGGGSRQQ
ncbi:Gypsy retrotransposon integrase-like protein 1 [Stygiomarasmius scandens]|uniref:Gypsy retrotransposon integrase-like protein 1 n=1 Tax=Marasmiellus scandens TaxID=2682957 RepID=A0ABR1K6F4_9AGAR